MSLVIVIFIYDGNKSNGTNKVIVCYGYMDIIYLNITLYFKPMDKFLPLPMKGY